MLDDINTTDLSLFDSPEGVHELLVVFMIEQLMPYRNVQIFRFQSIKRLYKFWWNQKLDLLKKKAISSNKIWNAAGKPHSGPIFQQRKSDKLAYKIII